MGSLLEVRGLATHFYTGNRIVRAVDGVDLSVKKGENLGIVGETGSGKSVMALSIMRLIPWPPGKIVGGSVVFEGQNLLKKDESAMRSIRGRKMAMIFQEPRTSMNPVFRIGDQMVEVIMLHKKVSRKQANLNAVEMLERVQIADPARVFRCYPHELSGGMLQRAMIATALSCNPSFLFADEPTTALDVTIQAQILKLLRDLQQQMEMSLVFITHDLGIVAQVCDRVMVMYAGIFVESASVNELFENPLHPYTQGLMGAIPRLDTSQESLAIIPGNMPDLSNHKEGCRFYPRCPSATEPCRKIPTEMVEIGRDHFIAACTLHNGASVRQRKS